MIINQDELSTFKKRLMTLLLTIKPFTLLSCQRMSGQQFLKLLIGSKHSDLQQHKCQHPRSQPFLQCMPFLGASRTTFKEFIAASPVQHLQESRLAFLMPIRSLVTIIIGMTSCHSIHGLLMSCTLGLILLLIDHSCSP